MRKKGSEWPGRGDQRAKIMSKWGGFLLKSGLFLTFFGLYGPKIAKKCYFLQVFAFNFEPSSLVHQSLDHLINKIPGTLRSFVGNNRKSQPMIIFIAAVTT